MKGGDMRSFNVFSNDDGDYTAVKQGWCWPAFFFGSIWALFSGLWLAAFLLLPIDLVFSITGNNTNGYVDPYDRYDEPTRLVVLAVSSVLLTIRILFGLFGNALRTRKLRRLGFSHVGHVKADGKAHAISLCKAAPSDSGSQRAEPMAARAPSVSSPAITPHVEPERPVGLGEPRREKITQQGFPPHWLGWSIAALSILAVADMPYGYYQLLRLLVTGYMGYLAALYFIRKPSSWAWAFAFIALLYNPVFVITMSKEFHALVNLIAAAAIAWEIKKLRGAFLISRPIKAPH
ncbi:DUF6804 family protein [Sphingobium indicum]|uniref:DUF2628 domain-containing protein n=2 Tax=Sphingomonadaceae TaxID=41297 RepID=UPI0003875B4B|nr:hypothetical protein L286_22440 [Sphingobium sp. HDIP04]